MAPGRPRLRRGDLLPDVRIPPPGPRARRLARRAAAAEPPGIDTLHTGLPVAPWAEARGANVLDVDGNRYVDLTSGFGAATVGHRHPRVVAAVRRQSARLLHGLGDVQAHPARVALAAALAARAPLPEARVYFAVSGSDAVEVALATALLATGRPGIVAFEGAYHGLSLGALALNGRAAFRTPFAPLLHGEVRRLPFGCPGRRLAGLLARDRQIGCLIVEPIQGRQGVRLPPPGWLAEVAAICRRHGVLLVVDEILTGGGRTGPLWAVTDEGVVPDLVCCGKALAGGLPLAAVLGRAELLAAWPRGEALHTATFLAHPLACAAALAVLAVLDDPAGQAAAAELSARLAGAVERFGDHPAVAAVRGRGLLWGIALRQPGAALSWCGRSLAAGVIALPAGPHGEVLELLPPRVTTPRQLDVALAALSRSLSLPKE
ncbi:MAG TPA: aspartate aminotransferase family protein [Thermoanaerobaculia bacterium]|nr:aspartate aminotransferase family protein [Thermoanaerobaculia bacterium]